MKRWVWCLVLCGHQLYAQTEEESKTRSDKPPNYTDISGNPYLLKGWSDGVIRFSSGRVITQFKLKFDCLNNQLLLLYEGSTFAAESRVMEFVIYPESSKSKNDSMLFRKGFPVADKANEQTFYQVLLQGKSILLRLFIKQIIEEKQMIGSTRYRKTEDVQVYYLFKDNQMFMLPQEKNSVYEIFPDKREELRLFISQQQLKMRSPEDFIKLVRRYNELVP